MLNTTVVTHTNTHSEEQTNKYSTSHHHKSKNITSSHSGTHSTNNTKSSVSSDNSKNTSKDNSKDNFKDNSKSNGVFMKHDVKKSSNTVNTNTANTNTVNTNTANTNTANTNTAPTVSKPVYNVVQTFNPGYSATFLEFRGDRFEFKNSDSRYQGGKMNQEGYLGGFNGTEFVDYVFNKVLGPSKIGAVEQLNSYVIEKYVCDVDPSKLDTLDILKFKECADSPFTGDIKMVFKLYKQIENYGRGIDFSRDNQAKSKVFLGISSSFLNHILKVIATLSDITRNEGNDTLNNDLMRYSNLALHRLLTIHKTYIDKKVTENQKIKKKITTLENDKQKLSRKVDEVQDFILKNMSTLSMSESISSSVGGGTQSSTSDMANKIDPSISTSTPLTFSPINGFKDMSEMYSESLDYLSSNKNQPVIYDKDQVIEI